MYIFAVVAFKATGLTEIFEYIQKVLVIRKEKQKQNGRWFEGKLT